MGSWCLSLCVLSSVASWITKETVTRLALCMFFCDVDNVVDVVAVYCYVDLAIVVSSHWARTLYVIL